MVADLGKGKHAGDHVFTALLLHFQILGLIVQAPSALSGCTRSWWQRLSILCSKRKISSLKQDSLSIIIKKLIDLNALAISAEANRHISRLTWMLVENLDTSQELRSKTTYRFWANQLIYAELHGPASSLLLFKTASDLSTLCRHTLYHITF